MNPNVPLPSPSPPVSSCTVEQQINPAWPSPSLHSGFCVKSATSTRHARTHTFERTAAASDTYRSPVVRFPSYGPLLV